MNIRYLPDYLANKVEDIPPSFFKKRNIKAIFCDMDNTLAPTFTPSPDEKIKRWKKKMNDAGIEVFIASNGFSGRVRRFADDLEVDALGMTLKPFAFKLVRWVLKKGYLPGDIAFIGDQMFTDVPAAKKAGFLAILCDPLDIKDSVLSYANRIKDAKARVEIREKHLVPHWREEE